MDQSALVLMPVIVHSVSIQMEYTTNLNGKAIVGVSFIKIAEIIFGKSWKIFKIILAVAMNQINWTMPF